MSQTDTGIYKPFVWVLGALVLFTVVIAVLANSYSPKSDSSTDPLVQQSLLKQISPVGQSRVESDTDGQQPEPVAVAPDAVAPAAGEVAATVETEAVQSTAVETQEDSSVATVVDSATAAAVVAAVGTATDTADTAAMTDSAVTGVEMVSSVIPVRVRAVVATNCAGCHEAGVRGAPRNDDVVAWATLAEQGVDALTASVISGKGAMMPRAGTSLSDEELGQAVRHMLALNLPDEATTAAVENAPETVVVENTQPQAEALIETEEATGSTAAAEVADDVGDQAKAATVAVQASIIPDNVKGAVDSLCASCHISGVGNAPKFGDKAAWEQVLSAGIDKVLASAIAGKGLMPARGGSGLSDAELRLAIEYMSTK